ncbi:aldo/keto reductase [Salsipaludibacter albus]|uniref:aldo/keto reductase n=1 Tax=Salsipaludibacter albus TaxID=2849650 RepID=UPI001EE3C465|nr:aldo/keto reductase [Salsipaludibacter albus]MBY5163398.1 aldo/keto reductase [Salsipaludibacter albus]
MATPADAATDIDQPAHRAGTFHFLGGPEVTRMGYGAMRITGPGIWGPPDDPDEAIAILRRAVELGVDFIDTADSYGPFVSEDLIREALHPYDGLTVATKAGLLRTGPEKWIPCGRPAYLRQCVEMSLRRLDVEQIDLLQLHRIDADVPMADQVGELADLREEGKIAAIGLSQVDVETLEDAREITDIVAVQNLYNLADRSSHDVLERCEALSIGFVPWFPIAGSELVDGGGAVSDVADDLEATPAQVALAWLLATSPVMLPIPGTSSLDHLEENVRAAELELSNEQMTALDSVASA